MLALVKQTRDRYIARPSERRRGLRIAQQRPVKVFEPSSTRFIGGQTHDVSTTGLRIELPVSSPIQEGKLLSIHVGAGDAGPSLANRRQMIPARVVWIDRGTGAKLMAGVEFFTSISAHLDAA
ncbi:MAG TPA: PilZ domain-containing protein [Tepidisphaeraceae bacterium]|nr:PilZ domain-containing protein [Tepidisphaeraceae bacterium]